MDRKLLSVRKGRDGALSGRNRKGCEMFERDVLGLKKSRIVTLWTRGSFIFSLLFTTPALAQSKEVFGYVERLHIREASLVMLAKLDTGADTSSIQARQLHEFEKDGAAWVRFEIRNFQGEVRQIEAPVVRVAKIKRPSGPAQRRIIIKLGLCLGDML